MLEPQIFKVDLSKFSANEKKAINELKDVGYLIHKIWEKQIDAKTGEGLFYDKSLSKEEIEKAAKKDKKILSPYTIVKKIDGKIKAVSYTKEYKEELKEISEKLKTVSKLVKSKEEKEYFSGLAEDYAIGDFDNALVRYVKEPDTKIFVLMGPIETYLDVMFGVKKVFQFNLRVLLEKETNDTKKLVEITKASSIVKPLGSSAQDIAPEKVKVSVCDVLMFSGRQAGTNPSSTNLPDDSRLVKILGTKIVFYRNSMHDKFDKILMPYFDKLEDIDISTDKEKIRAGFYRFISLHEIVEGTVKYADTKVRLNGYVDAIRELNASLIGMKNAKYMNLSGYLSNSEYIQTVIALTLYVLDAVNRRDVSKSIMQYAKGFAVIYNFGEQEGVFKIKNRKLVIDLEMLPKLSPLMSVVLTIFSQGDEYDAKDLFEKYGSFDFAKKLGLN